jgi:hypothetical protein
MKAIILGMAAAITFFVASAGALIAQEVIPTPPPEAMLPHTDESPYRWIGGHWWYRMPDGHWMWYSNDGHWVDFRGSAPVSAYPNGAYANGESHVAVGRRIGVDVWGDHGGVRVGPLHIAW